MPRVYDSTADPHDFCQACFPNTSDADERFAHLGDGPDERGNCYGYDEDHPDYDGEDYHCEDCKKLLTEHDNDPPKATRLENAK